jgi:hypothetical protein
LRGISVCRGAAARGSVELRFGIVEQLRQHLVWIVLVEQQIGEERRQGLPVAIAFVAYGLQAEYMVQTTLRSKASWSGGMGGDLGHTENLAGRL